jgi:hypothetical protein
VNARMGNIHDGTPVMPPSVCVPAVETHRILDGELLKTGTYKVVHLDYDRSLNRQR